MGFVYNVRSSHSVEGDEDAEFDAPETIEAISDAIASHGHEVVGLEADRTLPAALMAAEVDVVFNIAEGKGVAFLRRGEGFGEIALLRDVPRTATVTSRTPVKLYAFERDAFLAAVTGHSASEEAADALIVSRMSSIRS